MIYIIKFTRDFLKLAFEYNTKLVNKELYYYVLTNNIYKLRKKIKEKKKLDIEIIFYISSMDIIDLLINEKVEITSNNKQNLYFIKKEMYGSEIKLKQSILIKSIENLGNKNFSILFFYLHLFDNYDYIATLLLEKNADINIKNNLGNTPLVIAADNNNNNNISKLLLKKSYDKNIKDKEND